MALPLLVVVSGPPGSGKTTLAHDARAGDPVPGDQPRRDQGRARARAWTPTRRRRETSSRCATLDVFFGIVGALVDARVSLVAEAAFQHRLWAPGLTPLLDRARIHIVRCHADPAVAWERINRRAAEQPARRLVHGDPSLDEPFESFVAKLAGFEPVALPVPTIEVDTSVGLDPGLEAILLALARPRLDRADGSPAVGPGFRRAYRPGSGGLSAYASSPLAGPL